MKKFIFITILTLTICHSFGQQVQFIKYYGDGCPDFGLSLDTTVDGGYILLGHTQNFGALVQDMYLIKVDSLGSLQWQKLFGGAGLDFGQCIRQTADKGFILCGFTNSSGAGGYDIYLVKTDSLGNFQWQQTYGGNSDDYGYCVKQTSDNGYIICGSTKSFGSGNIDAILIKTDSSGNQQWSKYYGGTGNDGVYSLDITNDGGYMLAGYTYNFGALSDDAMLIKTDSSGNQQWLKIYGGTNSDRVLSVKQCPDKGYCAAGYTNSFGNGSSDMYLIRTDSAGNMGYYKTYGGIQTEKAYSIDVALDKGFILAGQTNSFGAGNDDMYIVKTDSVGNMDWQKFFGGAENDEGFTVKATDDKSYIAIGNTYSFSYNSGYSDVYLVKMDSTGYAVGVNEFNKNGINISIYPNPTKGKLFIESMDNEAEFISVINIYGQTVYQRAISRGQTEIDISDFANGFYLFKVTIGQNSYVKKIIKE